MYLQGTMLKQICHQKETIPIILVIITRKLRHMKNSLCFIDGQIFEILLQPISLTMSNIRYDYHGKNEFVKTYWEIWYLLNLKMS